MKNSRGHLPNLRLGFIIVLVVGTCIRSLNLGHRMDYDADEAVTSLRVSGHTLNELVQQVYDSHEISVGALQKKYMHLSSQKGLQIQDTIKSLAVEDPQHPPLYYIMLHGWVRWLGDSVAVTRSLSAVFGVLAILCAYWLCLELFHSAVIGVLAAALIAVSPLEVLYAQVAREYSLWMCTILLSSTVLLLAVRVNRKGAWAFYAATISLALYTFLLSALVIAAHGIYILVTQGFRLTKVATGYLLLSFVAFVVSAPWWLIAITNWSQIQTTTQGQQLNSTLLVSIRRWISNCITVFFNFSNITSFFFNSPSISLGGGFVNQLLRVLILALILYSVYFLCRNRPRKIWLFIVALIAVNALPFMLFDLIYKQRWATYGGGRYFLAAYLGVQLAVAHFLAAKLTATSTLVWQHRLWLFVTGVLLLGGGFSSLSFPLNWQGCLIARQIINQAPRPLLVSNADLGCVLPLIYCLDEKVCLRLGAQSNLSEISGNPSDVFVLNVFAFSPYPPFKPLPPLQSLPYRLLEQNYYMESLYKDAKIEFWQIKNGSLTLFGQ